jgi:hypothetical protein
MKPVMVSGVQAVTLTPASAFTPEANTT